MFCKLLLKLRLAAKMLVRQAFSLRPLGFLAMARLQDFVGN